MVIQTHHLNYIYNSGSLAKSALSDITLEIERGSCAAIIGVTGSGKSTLVQHFNGLLTPSSGEIFINGEPIPRNNEARRRLRQQVGMLFQFPETQLFARTVATDVAFGPQRLKLGRDEVQKQVREALEIVGLPLEEFGDRSPFSLSGGQMRRVAMAGMLAMAPNVLVLDEPTTGLDADARLEFYQYLEKIRRERGVTIILVSHDMSEVARLADRLFVLAQGHLIMQGTPQELFAEGERLNEAGLGLPPLSELTLLLRRQGIALPAGLLTVEEISRALQKSRVRSKSPKA